MYNIVRKDHAENAGKEGSTLSKELYTVVAGAMRYVFVLLGILIVLRAFLMLRRDRRVTDRTLRRLPDAGLIGEFEVLRGGDELEEGSVLPLPAEGTLGFYRSCDLTLPCPGVRKRHLDFMLDDRYGLLILPRGGCTVTVDGVQLNARSKPKAHPMLHGSTVEIGEALLRLRLFAGVCPEGGAAFAPDPEPAVSGPAPANAVTAPAGVSVPDPCPNRVQNQVPYTAPEDPFRNAAAAIPDLAVPVRRRHSDGGEGEWGE